MRIKHLLTLKQNLKPSPWKNLATYWLTIDIHNYSKNFQFLMDNNRAKTLYNKKIFYYQNIVHYIKNNKPRRHKNKNWNKIFLSKNNPRGVKTVDNSWWNPLEETFYQLSTIYQIWKNTFELYAEPSFNNLHYRLLHYPAKTIDTNAQTTTTQTVTTVESQKTTYAFYKMLKNTKIWTHYQTILTKLIGKSCTQQQHLLTLNVTSTNKHSRKPTLTIIQIILFEIFQSTYNNKYDQNLQTIVQVHYKKNKLKNTLDQLRKQFSINEAIAK